MNASAFCRKHGFKEMQAAMPGYSECSMAVSMSKRVVLRNTAAAPDAKIIMLLLPEETEERKGTQKRRVMK